MLLSLTWRHLGDRVNYGPGTVLAYSPDAAKDEKVTKSTYVLLFRDQPILFSFLLNHELKPVGIPGFLLRALFRARRRTLRPKPAP